MQDLLGQYRVDGKEKLLALGAYPDVPLKLAREHRDEARRLLADGIDPGEHRKAHKSARADAVANSFETVAREWYSKMLPTWSPGHANKISSASSGVFSRGSVASPLRT